MDILKFKTILLSVLTGGKSCVIVGESDQAKITAALAHYNQRHTVQKTIRLKHVLVIEPDSGECIKATALWLTGERRDESIVEKTRGRPVGSHNENQNKE